jgi:uncharacterized protein (TIGR01777 family)
VRFLLSGSSGFVGKYLHRFLQSDGHEVRRLVRHSPQSAGEFQWDPEGHELNADALNGVEVVINLNGASIAGKRWTKAYKQELTDSRVKATLLLAETMTGMLEPPRLFISFSGAGYYGYHDSAVEVSEHDPRGSSFIATLAQSWEHAAKPATAAGISVLHPRLGIVIGNGGMLAKLLPVFRLGLGARLGSGRQPFSWIALDDIGPALLHCIEHKLAGPVNFTGPHPATNAGFTRALARELHRRALFTATGFALRLMLGQVSDELLQGATVVPRRLLDSGYRFRYPDLVSALRQYIPQLLARR